MFPAFTPILIVRIAR